MINDSGLQSPEYSPKIYVLHNKYTKGNPVSELRISPHTLAITVSVSEGCDWGMCVHNYGFHNILCSWCPSL